MANLLGTVPDISEIYGHLENATLQGMSAYEVAVKNGYTGTEAEWLASLKGETGETPNIQVGNVSTGQPGTNASATMTGTKESPVLNMTIPRGDVGATPNMTIGTVATGEEGSQAQATITGTPENPVLNLTIPRGDTGDDGFNPVVEVTKDGNTATVSVTDATHTTEVNIVDGYTPQKNVDYFDGHSPKITGSKSQGTTFIYSDGEQIGAITDGQDGYTPRKGVDYFDGHTPAISGEKIDDTTFIYADGVRIATVLDGLDGNSPVITTVKSGKTTSILADSVVIGTVSDGADGHTPTITTTKSGKTTTIFADGTSVGTISDGQDGHSPEITTNKVGKVLTILSDGQTIGTVSDGADGTTPVITATKSEGITTIKANGIDIATINDGVAGDDGYSPTASVTKSGGISTLTVTDENGTTTTQILDGTGMIASDPNNDGNIVLSSVVGVQIDEEPISGSTNAISSGGVYNELTDLKSDLSEMTERVYIQYPSIIKDGWYVDTSKKILSENTSRTYLIDLTEIDKDFVATISAGNHNRFRILYMTDLIDNVGVNTSGIYEDVGNAGTNKTFDVSELTSYNTVAICTNYSSSEPYATLTVQSVSSSPRPVDSKARQDIEDLNTNLSGTISELDTRLDAIDDATSTDVGKYPRVKTVSSGKVTEWEFANIDIITKGTYAFPISWTSNKGFYNKYGAWTAQNSFVMSEFIDIGSAKEIKLTARVTRTDASLIQFWASDKETLIEYQGVGINQEDPIAATYTVPEGAVYFTFSSYNVDRWKARAEYASDTLPSVNGKVYNAMIDAPLGQAQKYISVYGTIENNAGTDLTEYIPCKYGDIFTVKAFKAGAGVCRMAICDENKNILAVMGAPESIDYSQLYTQTFEIPYVNAAYCIFSVYKKAIVIYKHGIHDILPRVIAQNQDALNYCNQLGMMTNYSSTDCFTLLHFSDIHGDGVNLSEIQTVKDYLGDKLDVAVCTGDMAKAMYEDSNMDFWSNCDGSILTCMGNHDVLATTDSDYRNQPSEAELVARYFTPYITAWDVVQPEGKLYYYKDFASKKIRLIMLNSMYSNTEDIEAQSTWLTSVLNDAITNDYAVVIGYHYYPADRQHLNFVDCNFTAKISLPVGTTDPRYCNNTSTYQDIVKSFSDNGGEFICWLVGHKHSDFVCYDDRYPGQMFIGVAGALCIKHLEPAFTEAGTGYDMRRLNNTQSQDCMNIIAVDRASKLLKIVRIGSSVDVYLRSRKSITFNYQTKNIEASN